METNKQILKELQGRDCLCLTQFSKEELLFLLDFSAQIKKKFLKGESYKPLEGKTLGMIFHKPSTRTRVSFEVGMVQLGGYPLFLNATEMQLGRGEAISDTAQVLSRYLDGIMIRTFSHESVEELAEAASIPIINGLTDLLHPCQILADLLTIQEKKGVLEGLKMTYVGDGNNVAHSLMTGCAMVGMNVSIATPKGFEPDAFITKKAQAIAAEAGAEVFVTNDIAEAARYADILYTDVWASMGQESEAEEKSRLFKNYQINSELLNIANSDALVMHCLPAHRGEEVTAEALDSPNSVIFDQAENRLHAQKGLLAALL